MKIASFEQAGQRRLGLVRNKKQVPPPLTIGDIVTMKVDGLGTVQNTVIAGPPEHPMRKS